MKKEFDDVNVDQLYRSWEERGCICSIYYTNHGESVKVSVHRIDHPEVGDESTFDLFNPYAFFGFDYEDAMEIDKILDSFLTDFGDPVQDAVTYALGIRKRV